LHALNTLNFFRVDSGDEHSIIRKREKDQYVFVKSKVKSIPTLITDYSPYQLKAVRAGDLSCRAGTGIWSRERNPVSVVV